MITIPNQVIKDCTIEEYIKEQEKEIKQIRHPNTNYKIIEKNEFNEIIKCLFGEEEQNVDNKKTSALLKEKLNSNIIQIDDLPTISTQISKIVSPKGKGGGIKEDKQYKLLIQCYKQCFYGNDPISTNVKDEDGYWQLFYELSKILFNNVFPEYRDYYTEIPFEYSVPNIKAIQFKGYENFEYDGYNFRFREIMQKEFDSIETFFRSLSNEAEKYIIDHFEIFTTELVDDRYCMVEEIKNEDNVDTVISKLCAKINSNNDILNFANNKPNSRFIFNSYCRDICIKVDKNSDFLFPVEQKKKAGEKGAEEKNVKKFKDLFISNILDFKSPYCDEGAAECLIWSVFNNFKTKLSFSKNQWLLFLLKNIEIDISVENEVYNNQSTIIDEYLESNNEMLWYANL